MSRNAEAIMGVVKSKMVRQAVRIAELEAALAPFARAAESYDEDPPAHVVASKGGAIISVYDLRIAKRLSKSDDK